MAPPDPVFGVTKFVVRQVQAIALERLADVLARVQHHRQWHLEDLCNFRLGWLERTGLLDPADHWRDAKAGAGGIVVEIPEQLDTRRRQADLFLRFSQRRCGSRCIGGIAGAAGKADLAAVFAQMIGATRQHHLHTGRPVHQRDQHRCSAKPRHRVVTDEAGQFRRQLQIGQRAQRFGSAG